MNRTKKFFYNTISSIILQLVTFFAGLVTPRIFLLYYGSDINGLISSVSQFITYFNLVEAGLSGAAIYALYKPLADNDPISINSIVTAAKRFYKQAGWIFVGLVLVLALFYPLYIKSNIIQPWEISALVFILGVNGALEFFTLAKYRSLLTADQRTYIISIASGIHILLNTIIVFAMAKAGTNIVLLRLVAVSSLFVRTFILQIYCKIKYPFLDYSVEPNFTALNKRWDALYLQILGAIQSGAPIVIMTLIIKDLSLISVYAVYNMVLGGINTILSVFTNGLAASFGDIIARNDRITLARTYNEFEFGYYFLISFVYVVSFLTISQFINIYTQGIQDAQYNRPLLGTMFVLNGFLYNLKTPQGMLVISAGLYKETRMQSTIQGGIIIVVGTILAIQLGIYGVMIGAILSNLYRDIDLLFYIPRHVTHLPVAQTAKRILRNMIAIIAIMFLFRHFIHYTPYTYMQWAGYACVASLFSGVVLVGVAILFDKTAVVQVWSRVKVFCER